MTRYMDAEESLKLTLIAHVISAAEILIQREKPKTYTANQLAGLLAKAEAIEQSIQGLPSPEMVERSKDFYAAIETATTRLLKAHRGEAEPTVTRCKSTGRFMRLAA